MLKPMQADVIMLQETQYTTMVSTFWPALSPAYHVLHSTPYEGAQFALEMTKASFLRFVLYSWQCAAFIAVAIVSSRFRAGVTSWKCCATHL
jgi:hypothetical protein